MLADSPPLLVTGANGHLGRSLAHALGGARIRAVVRSERAADTLRALPEVARPEIQVRSYSDEAALTESARGCGAWVHLVGILKEGGGARYGDAHEGTCEVVARAAAKAGIRRVVYPSILGTDPASTNACLASKGRAERILQAGEVPVTVLRLPMVLGPGELAAAALAGRARARFVFLTRGGRTLEQPIDSRDVVAAVLAAAQAEDSETLCLDLAGPESLPHRELLRRVAQVLGSSPRILPMPLALVRGLARVFEAVSGNPPLTRAMLDVLEHDDAIDPGPGAARLGIQLTPLADTLRHTFGRKEAP